MAFDLSVLNRVYNFVWASVCQQGISCKINLTDLQDKFCLYIKYTEANNVNLRYCNCQNYFKRARLLWGLKQVLGTNLTPWEPNMTHRQSRCQLSLLSINFDFRNVIFQPMVFPFVWAKYKWKFVRDGCKLSFRRPLAASPLARAFSRDSLHSPK